MIVSAGFAEPWVGSTLPSAMNRLGTPQTRWSASTTPCSRVARPSGSRRRGGRSGRSSRTSWAPAASQDRLQRALRGGDVACGRCRIGCSPCARPACRAGRSRRRRVTRFSGLGQELATARRACTSGCSRACTRAAPAPQWPSARTCSAQVIGSGPTVWIEKPRAKPRCRIGLVELLGADLRRRRLVHAQLVREPTGDLRRALHHQVAARPGRGRCRGRAGSGALVEFSSSRGRLDRVAGDRDGVGALEVLASRRAGSATPVTRPVTSSISTRAAMQSGADLRAVLERVGNVGDQRRGLGVDLAALQAEAAVDAVRPVAEACRW